MEEKIAIIETKRLWNEIYQSGMTKEDFLFKTPNGIIWREKGYNSDCPLCEFVGGYTVKCPKCPLVKQFGKTCFQLGYCKYNLPLDSWLTFVRRLRDETIEIIPLTGGKRDMRNYSCIGKSSFDMYEELDMCLDCGDTSACVSGATKHHGLAEDYGHFAVIECPQWTPVEV